MYIRYNHVNEVSHILAVPDAPCDVSLAMCLSQCVSPDVSLNFLGNNRVMSEESNVPAALAGPYLRQLSAKDTAISLSQRMGYV